MLVGNKILFFGGSGSLGHAFLKTYLPKNKIVNYSRDESKHWTMEQEFKSPNLRFVIGDIRDAERVKQAIVRERPNLIIIASALKHIDRCEYAVHESLLTNFTGTENVLNAVEQHPEGIEGVVFISTDKACEPTNVYGMCKALSETAMIERARVLPNIKFVVVRYGNVLNSRGSIIPFLHEIGKNPDCYEFPLTHPEMTRFVMTLDQSIELIEHAIIHAESGDIVIPTLISLRLLDLFELFSEKYGKPIQITKLRPGEKMLECLISETQALRLRRDNSGYRFIKPPYKLTQSTEPVVQYTSKLNPLSKEDLKNFLIQRGLF